MKKQTAFSLALLLYSLVVEYNPNSYAAAEGDQKNNTAFELPLPVLAKCKPHIDAYIKFKRDQIATLATKYGRAIDARLKGAVSAKDAEAFRTEHSRLAVLTEALTVIPEKSQGAIGNLLTLPALNSGTPSSLVDLRKIWIAEREKIELKSNQLFQRSLRKLEMEFSEAGESENAKTVLSYRQSLGLNDSDNGSTKSAPSPSKTKENGMKNRASAIASATKDEPFKNTLGMPFVPVSITGGKTDGITILFCIWETRVKDYAAFIRKNRDRQWKEPNFKQKNDHPAVNVSWDDAVAFCEWLTEIERSEGKIGNNEKYRLPSDHEWSCAVGIGEKEDADLPPAAKFSKINAIYPWGQGFPPKKGSGNYYGEENSNNPRPISVIKGYRDGFEQTSPVGSFDPNVLGLYDMGGNVWEWCQDWFDPERRRGRVYRGACWIFSDEKVIRSSGRGNNIPGDGFDVTGVRLVLSP